MAAISEAKRAANRENAKRSTGPRTDEGKRRSRGNALKHGLAGEGVVRAEEMEESVQRRVAEWAGTLRPASGLESWLVERVAVDSARVDAAVRAGRGRLAARMRKDELNAQGCELDDLRAARLGEKLLSAGADDRAIRHRLRSTSAGCSWLIAGWEAIARRQDRLRGWAAIDFERAERLMGGGAGPIGPRLATMAMHFLAQLDATLGAGWNPNHGEATKTRAALRERLALSGWFPEAFAPSDVRPGTPEAISHARDSLRALIAEEIAELAERRDHLTEIEAADAAEVPDRAGVDLSPDGVLLSRYESELHRRVLRSLRELERLQSRRADEPEPPPASPEDAPPDPASRNEPTAAPNPFPSLDLRPAPPRLPSPFRLDAPELTPPLPIRMVPAASHARR